MALTNWNDILNKPKGIDQIEEIALEVSELSSSVLTIAGDVQELELSVADLSASVLEVKGDVTEIKTKHILYGDMLAIALNNGTAHTNISIPEGDYNVVTLSKSTNVSGVVYGDKGYAACNFTINAAISQGTISLVFTPDITLSTYVTLARSFGLSVSEKITMTLSKTTQAKKTTKKK